MKNDYAKNNEIFLMNHKNGDVLKVTVDDKDKKHDAKNIKLYRQDGLGNYYSDKKAQLKGVRHLETKKDIIKAGREIGAHNTHHLDKWHHKVSPIYSEDHHVTDFEPKVKIAHHTRVKNAKRYLRHLKHHHADLLLYKHKKGVLKHPWATLREAILTDRNKEIVIAHKVHKVSK